MPEDPPEDPFRTRFMRPLKINRTFQEDQEKMKKENENRSVKVPLMAKEYLQPGIPSIRQQKEKKRRGGKLKKFC